MGNGTVRNFEPGDLVTWYEAYADGFLTKDVGEGIVLEKSELDLGYESGPYVRYRVYRTKHSDKMYFEARELESINK
tara:strand:+ start:389 stop:619 length:231 start_codon:yes stop_codon:yes gene_type:complete